MRVLPKSLFFSIVGLLSVVSAWAQTPRVYLKFDGNLTDSSGAGIITSVTANGFTPTYAADRNNAANKAIVLPGSASLTLGANTLPGDSNQALGLKTATVGSSPAQAFTLAAWVYVDTNNTSGYQTVFGNAGSGAGTLHAGYNYSGTTRGHFGFDNNLDANGAVGAIDAQRWYHVAFVYTGGFTGQQRIYINGIPEITRTQTVNTLKVADLLIGNWGNTTDPSNDLRGRLDEVAVFNSALNGNQIQALFNGVDPTAGLPSTYAAPKLPGFLGAPGKWGIREIKGYVGISYGTLINADRIIRAYPSAPSGTKVDYQAPYINFTDPEGAGNVGSITNPADVPFGIDTPGADDNFLIVAKCAVRIASAGLYTFGFRGDDGSRLRVIGQQFLSSTAIGGGNPANPAHQGDAIYYTTGTGDSNTLGVVNLPAGDYNLELVWWEGAGGSSIELVAAPGSKTAIDSTFKLVGDTANGGLPIVADPDLPQVTTFTANGGSSLFVHNGSPSSFNLAWTTNASATTRSITPSVGGAIEANGSRTLSVPAADTAYVFTATNVFGDSTTKTVNVYINDRPILSNFTASNTSVPAGANVTLSWIAEGATALTLNGANVFGQSSAVVTPTATTTYTLVATNPSGATQQSVIVNVGPPPTINAFTASDTNALYGAEVNLGWDITNADIVSIDQGLGSVGLTGSLAVVPLQTTTYTLTATNAFAAVTASVTVNLPAPIGVTSAGFTVRRVSATTPFPFAGQGYLQSALSVLDGQNAGATTQTGGYTTINFADGVDGDFPGSVGFPGGGGDNFAVRITGTLVVNSPGDYTFVVNSDDGARLRIDGQDVIVDDGTHAPGGNSGRITLRNPTAQLELVYYDAIGGAEVELAWIRPNFSFQLLTTATPAPAIVRGQVVISEFMADNQGVLLDEDGLTSDWIEIWNSTAATVALATPGAAYYLTDNAAVPNKWPLPAWTLGPNKYMVVFAASRSPSKPVPTQAVPGQDNPGTLAQPRAHTNFSLSNNGEYLALTRDNGTGGYDVISSFGGAFPQQFGDVSYGSSDVEGYVGYTEIATPGAPNAATVAGFVADTVFTDAATSAPRVRGRYTSAFNLVINSATPGAVIRYTTDGSTPTINRGNIYTGPISIAATTVIRALATRPGWKPSNVDTQTYLFLDDVVSQSAATATAIGFPPAGRISPRNQILRYGMTLGNVSAGGGNLQSLKDALAAAPAVSMTTDISNLMDPVTGIYARSDLHGLFWERPASVEYINSAGGSEFQIDAGVRMRGGFSRSADNPKHAFHLYFRGRYDGDLKYRLFGANGAAQFSQIDMRCEQNYSWAFQNSGQNALVREEWARLTQNDMGQPYSRTGYFHLYINGIYWGIYCWEERTEATFGETYLGGSKDTTDVVKSAGSSGGYNTEMTDGNFAAWQSLFTQSVALKNDTASEVSRTTRLLAMQGLNAQGARDTNLPVLLDVENLIDYNLVVFYDGSYDSPLSTFLNNASNNWFGVRDRAGQRGFAFFVHDHEHGMDTGTQAYNRVGPWGMSGNNNWGQTQYNTRETFTKSNPQYLHELLCYSAEYRQRFMDRVQKHFFNGGALTTAKAQARINALAAMVDPIIHAEAARWGSTGLHKTTWINAKNAVIGFTNSGGSIPGGQTSWPAQSRTTLVLEQLKGYQDPVGVGKSLFTTFAPPAFSGSFGGPVSQPYSFTLTNPNATGAIYYTVNGLDPRPTGGGAPIAGAQTGASPVSVTLNSTATVRARVFDSATQQWSPLVDPAFLVGALAGASNLVISKIHYNPAGPGASEFLEVMNISAMTVDLTNVRFLLGVQFQFPDGFTLAPGGRAVVVKEMAAFTAAYPTVPTGQIAGVFANNTSLSDGEQLQLVDANSQPIRDFIYDNSGFWPSEPDGGGPALVLKRPETSPNHSLAENWRASAVAGGNPGGADGISYPAWAASNGVTDLAGSGDDDFDGFTTLAEYALGMNPGVASVAGQPTIGEQNVDVGGVVLPYLTITFTRPIGRDDVAYAAESASVLGAAWGSAVLVSSTVASGNETLTYRYPQPKDTGGPQFLRVRFTKLQ